MPGAAAVDGAAAGAGFAAAFFGAAFFAAGFFAAGFLAAAFFGAAFLAAGFFAAGFLAAAFFGAAFFAAGFAAAFFGAAFFAAGFLAAAFFGAAFFAAGFAAAFFGAAFFAAGFAAAFFGAAFFAAGFAAAFFGAAFFAAGFAAAFFGAAFFAAAGFFGAAAAFLAAGFLAFFSSAIVNLHCMFEKGKINNPPTTARIIQQRRRTGIDEFKRFPQPSLGLQQDGGTRQLGFRQDWKVGKHGLACGGNGGHDCGRGGIQPGNGLASIDYRAPCVFLHAPPFVGYCGKNCGSIFNYNLLYVVGQRPFSPNGSSSRFSMQDKLRVLCICMQKSVAVKPRDRSQTGCY